MTTSTIQYTGSLRVTGKHLKSGEVIFSDAPLDNKGKGQGFSPTDYCATSLAMCMLTIAGIHAESRGYDLLNTSANIIKEMASSPRRIAAIHVSVSFKTSKKLSSREQELIISAAKNCPVAKSLHPDVEQNLTFSFS